MIEETSVKVSFDFDSNLVSLTGGDFKIGIIAASVLFENVEFSTLGFGSDVVVTDTILNAATDDLKVSVESKFKRFVLVTDVLGTVVVLGNVGVSDEVGLIEVVVVVEAKISEDWF